MEGWETGRVALNSFFTILNDTTGFKNEMKTIPKASPTQIAEYGRSPRKYNDLMKKTRLCQNRGGPTLSAAWGEQSDILCLPYYLTCFFFFLIFSHLVYILSKI